MQATQKAWPAQTGSLGTWVRGLIAAIVTAISAAYGVLLLKPDLMRAAEPTLFAWGLKPAWVLTLTAAVSIVGATALAWILLARVAHGVQRAPYAWSAPVLLGAAGVALAQMPVQLPIPAVPVPLFAACTSALMLVGGALLQLRGWPAKVAGALVLSMPILSIAGADSLTPQNELSTWAGSASQGRGFVLVLCGTWLATIALALVASPPADLEDQGAPELRDPLGGAAWVPGRTRTDLFLGAVTLTLLATLAGGYTSVYLPLVRRVQAQQSMLAEAGSQQREALQSARAQFDRELANLRDKLDPARGRLPTTALAQALPTEVIPQVALNPRATHLLGSVAAAAVTPIAITTPPARGATLRSARATVSAKKAARVRHPSRTARAAPKRRNQAKPVGSVGPVAADDDPIGGLDSL